MSASKIYIDPNEDIVFAVSKINRAPAVKVILIVPNNANIISSQVSTKLLSRTAAATEKIIVVVTEDDLGRKFAEKAGIVTDTKVSNITNEHWEQALENKKKVLAAKDQKKAELIAQVKNDDFVIVDAPVPEPLTDESEADAQLSESGPVTDILSMPAHAGLTEPIADTVEKEVKPLFKKLDPKVIDLGDYAIVSGGDIAEDERALELREKLLAIDESEDKGDDKIDDRNDGDRAITNGRHNMPMTMITPKLSKSTADNTSREKIKATVTNLRDRIKSGSHKLKEKAMAYKADYLAKREVKIAPEIEAKVEEVIESAPQKYRQPMIVNKHSLTNANFARGYHHLDRKREMPVRRRGTITRGPAPSGEGMADNVRSKLAPVMTQMHGLWQNLKSGSNSRKALTGVAILVLVIIFMGFLITPKAEVTVGLKEQSVPVSQQVTAVEGVSSVDITKLEIPLRYVTKQDSRSETGNSTGTGEAGDKAKGKVNIFNYSDQEITLKSGTALTAITNGLSYRTTAEVKIVATGRADVNIEAVKAGEAYNLSSGRKDFKIAGQDSTKLPAFSLSGITGGTSKEVKVVAQADMDTLKTELTNVLKQSLTSEIDSLVSASEVKLSDQIIFSEPKVDSSKKAGDEGDTFDMTVTMEAKVAVIDKKHLEEVALALVAQNSNGVENLKVEELADPVISNVTQSGGKVTFNLSAEAKVTAGITPEELKSSILGMNVGLAEDKLNNMEVIESVELNYSPGYVPGFLKKLPEDTERIEVKIEK